MTQLIDLGKLRFFFAGEWDATSQYELNDVVKYGGNVYVYTFALATVGNLPTATSHWKLMLEGLRFKGVFNPASSYRVGDGVAYGGTVYVAIADSTGGVLPTDATKWSTFLDGIQYEGVYSSATPYQKNDVVSYGGGTFIAKRDALGKSPVDATYWTPFVSGVSAKGVYNTATAYAPGDLVAYGGYLYRALTDTTGNLPSNPVFWAPYLQGLRSRGPWDKTTTYRIGDLVQFGGASYRALGDVAAGVQPTVVESWGRFLDGVALRGNWTPAAEYAPGDLVLRGGSTYLCKTYHASAATFAADLAAGLWTKYNGGIRYRGAYQKSVAYLVDDVVTDGLNTYIATVDFTADDKDAIYQTGFAVLAKGADYLPGQSGKSGFYLSTDGVAPVWKPLRDDWQVVSNNFTITAPAAALFVDTTAKAITVTLPAAPELYTRVRLSDFAGTWHVNRLTIARNGNRIMGTADDLVADVRNAALELVFAGAANGWKVL